MTAAREPPPPVTAACIFGSHRLGPLLDAFSREIEGVKTARDPECIHRMRVASRRLRAALPLFAACFPEKKYRHWMQEIQRITRALGKARDTDVQIAFLQKLIKKQKNRPSATGGAAVSPDSGTLPVETLLQGDLVKEREKLQAQVRGALEHLVKSRVIDELQEGLDELATRQPRTRSHPLPFGIPAVAGARIGKRLDTLFRFEPWVHDPDAVAEHHAARIAAKKLRYTLEAYSPLYRRGLKKHLARVKKLQDLLGEIHDRDVWITTVTLMIVRERSRAPLPRGGEHGMPARITSLKQFLYDRERERKALHRQFVRLWDALRRARLWDDLRETLDTGRRTRYRLPAPADEELVRSAVSTLARNYPAGLAHARHVTVLACGLFDQLAPLHRLTARERFLLECAARLHDIGWKYGQQGHAAAGAAMILADETLPLDLIERAIIAVVARAHSGKAREGYGGIFSVLRPADRACCLFLASLLRIADGLDYLHEGTVQSAGCMIQPDAVIIAVDASRDASTEKSRALTKSDLFTRVFNREVVIR